MTVPFFSSIKRYCLAGLAVAIALVIMLILDSWISMSKTPFMLFFSAVMVSAWYGGLKPGIFATCLSIVFIDYFFLEPTYTLNFDPPNLVRIILFLLQGVIISIVCNLFKNSKRRSEINFHKLKSSEQRFRLTLKSADILIFHQDIELRYQWIYNHHNPERAKEILGKSDYDLFPASEAEQLTKIKRRVIETNLPAHEEVCLTVNGKTCYYDLIIEPLQINSAVIEGISCAAVNISQRKQTEQALRKSELRFQKLYQSNIIGIISGDKDGKIITANDAFLQIVGYSREDLNSGQLELDVLNPSEYQEITKKAIQESLVSGSFAPYEKEYFRKDGNLVSVLVAGIKLEDSLEAGVGFVIDLTERKRIEGVLRETEERLQFALAAAEAVAWEANLKTKQVICSQKAIDVLGIQFGTIEDFNEIIHPDDREIVQQANLLAITQQQTFTCEYRVNTPNQGLRWISSRGMAKFDLDKQPERIIGISIDITERKQTEEALRYSEERYRSLVESLPQLVCISPELGRLDYCNQSWINYTGLTLEQAQNSGWQQIIHPDDLPVFISKWTRANLTGKAVSLEFRLRSVDGIYRWYLGRGVPIRNQDGNILTWLASGTDIDDQKRKEQMQRFLAESSRAFAEASLNMQAVMDSITRRIAELFADACLLSLLSDDGLRLSLLSVHHVKPEAQELIGKLLANEDDSTQSLRGRVIQTGKAVLIPTVREEELYDAVKPEYWQYLDRFGVSTMLIVPLQVHGKIIGTLGVSRDRTGQPYNEHDQELLQDLADRAALAIENARLYRETQQALQKAEEAASRTARLQAVTAALSEALTPQQVADVVVNQGIATLGANSGSVTLLYDHDTNLKVISAIGYPQSVIDAWDTFPITLQAPLAETVRTGSPIFLRNLSELLARYPHLADTQAQTGNQAFAYIPLIVEGRKLGQFGISFAQEQAFGAEDKAFMLTLAQQCAQAIARAQLYEAEQKARDEAEVANRVKDEFLAVLSHELRTPLNPILGWSKLLRSRNLDEKTTIRALETIERNAQLQSQLIEDLLDISRIIRGNLNLNFSPVKLTSTIQAAIETVALSAQAKSIEIKTVIQPNIGQILGNSERLQQVVWNLLSNAIKFTPVGGQVEVIVETVDNLLPINEGNPQIAINNYVQIKVTDTGKGISPDFLPYVFDYFRQADATTTRTFGGLGLGLAIVRQLVELHGGSVQAESKGEGQGATFIVKLPLIPVASAINEKIELPSNSPNLSGVKILVVDDEADSLDFCAFVLEQQGAIVTKVASATAALQVLAEFQPNVLVSDIGMPEMDGYMLMRQIRALPLGKGAGISAIALTAYASEADQEQALVAGFNNHLSKPVDPSELAKRIANLIVDH